MKGCTCQLTSDIRAASTAANCSKCCCSADVLQVSQGRVPSSWRGELPPFNCQNRHVKLLDLLSVMSQEKHLLCYHAASQFLVHQVGAIVSWNYPFHNIMNPLTSAIFAGNAIVIKVVTFPLKVCPCSPHKGSWPAYLQSKSASCAGII